MQVGSATGSLPMPSAPHPVMRAEIPDVPQVLVAIGGRNPMAASGNALRDVWDAYQLGASGRRNEADSKLRDLFASPDPAVAWAASLELGALLALGVQSRGETALTSEGLGHLVQCMSSPFGDVAASAAWNISEILHMAGRVEAADQYAWVARDLGDPTALAVSAARASDAGQPDTANEIFGAVIHSVPRWLDERAEAEQGIAEFVLEASTEFTRDWFTAAQGSVSRHDWAAVDSYASVGAMFNVEGGFVSITSSGSSFTTLAGYGDGVYPAFTLHAGDESVGAVTVLKDLPNDLKDASAATPAGSAPLTATGTGEFLGSLLAGSAPLVLGHLNVDGGVVFADSARSSNGRDAAVDVPLGAGQYAVVAWMSIPLDDFDTVIRPLAFGVVRGMLADAIRLKTPKITVSEVELIQAETINNPSIRLASQENDVVPALLKRNAEQAADVDSRLSWLLQLAEVAPSEEVFYAIYGCPAPTPDEARRLLALRGFSQPGLAWVNWIPTALVKPKLAEPAQVVEAPQVVEPVETTPAPAPVAPPAAYIPPTQAPAPAPVAPIAPVAPAAPPAPPTGAMPVTSGPKFCTSCGAKRVSDSKFCTSCGAKLV